LETGRLEQSLDDVRQAALPGAREGESADEGLVGAQQPAEVGSQALVVANVAAAADETDLEVERRGALEGPPPAREDLDAGAVLGGEERDDAAENLVGEAADQVGGGGGAVSTSLEGGKSSASRPGNKNPVQDPRGDDARTWWPSAAS
jgi:hypothetical protein